MSDIAVALIAGGSAVLGAGVGQLSGLVDSVRADRRDRTSAREAKRHDAYLNLLDIADRVLRDVVELKDQYSDLRLPAELPAETASLCSGIATTLSDVRRAGINVAIVGLPSGCKAASELVSSGEFLRRALSLAAGSGLPDPDGGESALSRFADRFAAALDAFATVAREDLGFSS